MTYATRLFAKDAGQGLAGPSQYEIDHHVQPEFSDDSINVGCVLSWRLRSQHATDPVLYVDLHNGFSCTATSNGPEAKALIHELRRVQDGVLPSENALTARRRAQYPFFHLQTPDRH